ncbi:MAG: TolC family protein, partial [Acidobacteriaceae bacterium]|nr:TolC family protein [Acidobacteriaceae bacterium]
MRLSIVLFTATCFGVALHGQMPPGATSSGPSRAAQLPLSENGGGSVTTQQAVNPGSGPATVTSSVTVSGSYAGSVAPRTFPEGPIRVGLADAVRRGLETNLGSTTATNQVAIARSERLQSLSAMLPDISASASETVTQVNLAAYGLTLKLPSSITGFSFPTVVGPYEYSQLQGTLSQSIFDLVQRRNYKASKESERAAVLSGHDARELVVLAVAGTYLQALASEAQVASERAQVANAQAVYDQAVVRKAAGTNARIDVTRSLVELQTEQQRLTSLEADLRKQKITLARLAGLPLGHQLILTDAFTLDEIPVPSPEQA